MWNPLHFAVYYQNQELVNYFLRDLKVNVGLTAPKATAESEKEAVNTREKYLEDKIMILLMAFANRSPWMLKFLLDMGFRFWPQKTLEKLLNEKMGDFLQRLGDEGPQGKDMDD